MAWNAARMASGQSAPPVQTSVSEARSSAAIVVHRGQAVEEGGRTVPRGDPLGADPLGHALGVDPVHHDRAAARLRHEQRGEHRHVEHREREAVALAQRLVVAAGLGEHRPRHEQVVLAVDRALRVAGRAARVGETGRRERVDVDVERRRVGRARPRRATRPGRRPERRDPAGRRRRAAASTRSPRAGSASPAGASARFTPSQTAPRRMAPWKATTTSASFGSDAATRSPGPTPSSRRAWAARLASASSSA